MQKVDTELFTVDFFFLFGPISYRTPFLNFFILDLSIGKQTTVSRLIVVVRWSSSGLFLFPLVDYRKHLVGKIYLKKIFFLGRRRRRRSSLSLFLFSLFFQTRDALDSDFGHEGGPAPS